MLADGKLNMQCLYVAETTSPVRRDVYLPGTVSVNGDSNVQVDCYFFIAHNLTELWKTGHKISDTCMIILRRS